MKEKQLTSLAKRALCYALSCAMAYSGVAAGQVTEIAQEPLSQPASNIPPNVMLLYDDSGSMVFQYTPDYIGRPDNNDRNRLCHDSLDTRPNIHAGLTNCQQGDPPAKPPDLHTQYYNPTIRYLPAVNFDGSPRNSMSCANTGGTAFTTTIAGTTPPESYTYCTGGWTRVLTDGVSSVSTFQLRSLNMMEPLEGTPTRFADDNLTAYPDRVWCQAQGDSVTDTARCKTNAAWSYPDVTYGYGWSTAPAGTGMSNVKRKTGAPYYYRLATKEYCNNAALASTSADSPARCIAATSPTGAYTFPATVRYCRDSTLADCQGKYNTTYSYPKYAGNVNPAAVVAPAVAATATITVQSPQSDGLSGSITQINVNGVNLIGAGTGTCGAVSQ